MTCPACSEALSPGQDRCPACGAVLHAATEGALAPDLMRREPSERPPELPAFKKREPSWKDEVRQRMRHRSRQRSDGALLPLFPDADAPDAEPDAPEAPPEPVDLEAAPLPHEAAPEPLPAEPLLESAREEEPSGEVDLPLRPREAAFEPPALEPAEPGPPALGDAPAPRLVELGDEGLDAELEPELEAVERPAYVGERARAAAVDGLLLGGVSAVVVYFAARAARVPLLGLLPAWPYLAGFIAFFGLVYAAFFTGLTGQTLGKMLFRLRVVDRKGSPPGHARAALRATLGALGSLALVGIAPAFLDPARRALHDRALRTRVIRI